MLYVGYLLGHPFPVSEANEIHCAEEILCEILGAEAKDLGRREAASSEAQEIDCAEEMLCAEAQHLGSFPLRQFGVPRSGFMIWDLLRF